MKKRFLVMVSSLLLSGFYIHSVAAEDDNVKLEIVGLSNHSGTVNIAVFNKPDGFPNNPEKALRRFTLPISDNNTAITQLALPKGKYAFAVFHDTDGNGKLNKNIFGIPTEGYGFSGTTGMRLASPKFDDFLVTVGAHEEVVVIHLQND